MESLNEKLKQYRIFDNSDEDWYVAAKLSDGKPIVIYEGHDIDVAQSSILEDLGIDVSLIRYEESDEEMQRTGTYVPKPEDFQ